jgi:antitoxin component YwqK of YwqJK toxin-antitoxin module
MNIKNTFPAILVVFLLITTSCRFEQKVIEEIWPDGSPKRICIYKGKGESRECVRETNFYENHQMQMDGEYKDKLRTGKWTSWYPNGKIWSEGSYKNGKNEGRHVTYFENGKIRYEGQYKNDQRTGKWRFYDEAGKLLAEEDFSKPGK